MPLAFESLSHGTVAFGFFNIESDLLLLGRCFFFAADFCSQVAALADAEPPETVLRPAWAIEVQADIGDLMGAIAGVRHTGFIGAVYRRFPFPEDPAKFKQNPDGWKTRPILIELLSRCAVRRDLPITAGPAAEAVAVGPYRFSRLGFGRLIEYVWRGGYPRWKNDVRPDYVTRMAQALRESPNSVLAGPSCQLDAGRGGGLEAPDSTVGGKHDHRRS
jgi:hypothetical protein